VNPFTILAPPLGNLLSILYDIWPHNYGLAIILVTLMVSLVLFPLTLKQTRSMKAMQEIQPEIKRIQKEFKDDREEMNKQMMALYQERGINPAAGCLPLLLQMPIWFALYRVFRVGPSTSDPTALNYTNIIPPNSNLATALLHKDASTSFLSLDMLQSPSQASTQGWGVAIPAILLVVIVVISSFYQTYQTNRRTKTSNPGGDTKQGQQMQMVTRIMPLFMGFISWGFPMGLVLYFAVSNLFRVGQQAIIFRMDDEGGDGQGGKSGNGDDNTAPEGPKSGPSPNASKKRKRRRRK
jgi:YidC/Oxa1 family membrane protein insertase